MLLRLLLLACTYTSSVASVSYMLDVRDWVVDYQRPTVLPRRSPFEVPMDAKTAAVLANNSYPGPALEACEGDLIEVTVVNNLLGGQFAIQFDGVEVQASPSGLIPQQGGTFTYHLLAQEAGTFWWHASTRLMADRGLKGPLVVRSRHDPSAGAYQEERVVALAEERAVPEVCIGSEDQLLAGCPEIGRGSLNGQWGDGSSRYPLPVVEVTHGRCYLLRFIALISQPRKVVVSVEDHVFQIRGQNTHEALVTPGNGTQAVLCADKGGLLGGSYRITMTHRGEGQATSFFANLHYPIFSSMQQVGYV